VLELGQWDQCLFVPWSLGHPRSSETGAVEKCFSWGIGIPAALGASLGLLPLLPKIVPPALEFAEHHPKLIATVALLAIFKTAYGYDFTNVENAPSSSEFHQDVEPLEVHGDTAS